MSEEELRRKLRLAWLDGVYSALSVINNAQAEAIKDLVRREHGSEPSKDLLNIVSDARDGHPPDRL